MENTAAYEEVVRRGRAFKNHTNPFRDQLILQETDEVKKNKLMNLRDTEQEIFFGDDSYKNIAGYCMMMLRIPYGKHLEYSGPGQDKGDDIRSVVKFAYILDPVRDCLPETTNPELAKQMFDWVFEVYDANKDRVRSPWME